MTGQFDALLESVSQRWLSLPDRDRRALTVLLASISLLVLWFGIISPTLQWRESTRAELAAAESIYQQLVERAPLALAVGRQSSGTAVGGDSLNAEVRNQANRHGVAIQSFEPDGDQLRVRVANVSFDNVTRWLGALENQSVRAVQLTLEATDRAGQVSVQASFSR
jgi:type II secretory pathway component PulM